MQHTFYLQGRSVKVSITHGGKQYRRATGFTIYDRSLWRSKGKTIQTKCKDERILPALLDFHSRLVSYEAREGALSFSRAMKCARGEEDRPVQRLVPTFWEYFEEWGKRPSSSQRQRALTVRVVARLMGRDDNWEDVDSAYWFKLNLLMEEKGFSVNYRWNIGSRLKCVMHEGYSLKYHRNDDFRDFKLHKEQTEAIALTPSEIELLWAYEPTSELRGKVRDLALIGYYTASRFSDYSQLSMQNIREGRLEFVQKKTGDMVVIPASPRLVLLLERNGGRAPSVCQVVFNRYIKWVARDAGIGGVVPLKKSHQKKDGSPTYRWEMVQSHTMRRSALSNLYLSGVPIRDCMFCSGHKSMRSFQSYIKTDKEQAMMRLQSAEFFK